MSFSPPLGCDHGGLEAINLYFKPLLLFCSGSSVFDQSGLIGCRSWPLFAAFVALSISAWDLFQQDSRNFIYTFIDLGRLDSTREKQITRKKLQLTTFCRLTPHFTNSEIIIILQFYPLRVRAKINKQLPRSITCLHLLAGQKLGWHNFIIIWELFYLWHFFENIFIFDHFLTTFCSNTLAIFWLL